jgi:hypothetical protein
MRVRSERSDPHRFIHLVFYLDQNSLKLDLCNCSNHQIETFCWLSKLLESCSWLWIYWCKGNIPMPLFFCYTTSHQMHVTHFIELLKPNQLIFCVYKLIMIQSIHSWLVIESMIYHTIHVINSEFGECLPDILQMHITRQRNMKVILSYHNPWT